MSSNLGPNVFPIAAAVVIIVIAIAISAAVQGGTPDVPMSQIISVGPVWSTDAWTCTSDADFVVHAAIRGIGNDPRPAIAVSLSSHGTQSFISMANSEFVTFSVGNQADQVITITRTGTVNGFLTLQTTTDAIASCTNT